MSPLNPRVLIIDDFETVRLLFIKCLNELGILEISQAENGEDAWKMLKDAQAAGQPFDLVFSDWNMPKMNGFELLIAVRKDSDLAQLAFVMVTANSDEGAVVDAMRAGVSDYMVKPFDTRSLGRTMSRVVSRIKDAA